LQSERVGRIGHDLPNAPGIKADRQFQAQIDVVVAVGFVLFARHSLPITKIRQSKQAHA